MEDMKILINDVKGPSSIGKYLEPYLYTQNVKKDIIITCIGTDKCIGDCLGPLVGTMLKKGGFPFPVFGTLKNPIHAMNLKEKAYKLRKLYPQSFVIAIDACLGEEENVGTIQMRQGPIYPGKGVGKSLPTIGDLSIIGIVDSLKSDNSISLHSIRLAFVMEMAELIVEGLHKAIRM